MDRGAKTARTNAAAKRPVAKPPRASGTAKLRELETRLAAALEQQAATNEILRVIAASPGNVQPVLDAVARLAAQLCRAPFARVLLVDGDTMRAVADHSVDGETPVPIAPVVMKRSSITGRAVIDSETIHYADIVPLLAKEFPDARENAQFTGFRAVLAVPLIREAGAYGAIFLWRREPGLFAPDQVALVQTFARQAAIAIDNARLFEEVRARNGDLSEALEQQEATSEILRAIARSRTDVQPVFDIIAQRAGKLCNAEVAVVSRFDGKLIQLAAIDGVEPEAVEIVRKLYPMRLDQQTVTARVIRTASVVHSPDVLAERDYEFKTFARAARYRSGLGVPIIRGGQVIGSIFVGRAKPGLFSDSQVELLKTFSEQAIIAIDNVRLFTELEFRNHDLTEALEQQTATSEILRVISRSPTDVQPVFDTIAAAALRLCGASAATLMTYDGTLIHMAAVANVNPEASEAIRKIFPQPPSRNTAATRAILMHKVVAIPDVLDDPDYSIGKVSHFTPFRSVLAVPLTREQHPIGAIAVGRPESGPFSDKQIALLQTFADQAVIAIENVRLFTELEARNFDLTEALEQQTATSEILRAISSSPTDVQPVFDIIGESAERLCDAEISVVSQIDGDLIRLVALHGVSPEGRESIGRHFPMRLDAETVTARSVRCRVVVHIADALTDPDYESKDAALAGGYRACLGVPMFREGEVIGAIFVARGRPGLFNDSQVQLLRTFADQAVIAIENVRLFTELGDRNRDLTEALEQQTATSEILRVISQSQTDVQPVFDTIAAATLKLCGAGSANVFTFDGELIHLAALVNVNPEYGEKLRTLFPRPPSRDTAATRAVLSCSVVAVPDVEEDADYAIGPQSLAGGFRSILAVPLVREGSPIGVIAVGRSEPGPFPDNQIALLQTFADQAVIAIENVRLFNELGSRNRDLTEALEQQTATAEILRVISASPTDVQPVFEAIARNAVALCGSMFANVFRFDGELVHWAASAQYVSAPLELLRSAYPMRPSRSQVSGRVLLSRSVVHLEDALADPEFDHRFPRSGGWRRMLGVPMLRDGNPIGVIVVGWSEAGPIAKAQEELLKTFADQAVIAVENVRLFNELKARTTELTQSVGELKALGEVGQAVSSTLDLDTVLQTIVSRATQLAGVDGGAIYEYDEAREEFYLRTDERYPDELVNVLRDKPIRKGEGALGRLAVVAEPVQIRDIAEDRTYRSRVREVLLRLGYRSALAIPLVRDEHLLGGLVVNRTKAGEFSPQVIDLLKTFATQSALAIQNARLFREIGDKSRELEIASRHKSEFLANMSHELRTPLNAIIGFSEVLAEQMFGEINAKQAEYLGDILESGRHLLTLINDILDLSKIEAGRMELDLDEFSLPSAIDNTMTLVRERAHRRTITLERALGERVGSIRADERKVKQVLLNLLSNALKFTPEGGHICVRADVRDGMTEVSVTDTGVGIAPEDQATVFEEFRQVGMTAKKVEGTGLGLAISRKFIELHGGRIWVTSEVGVGSTFAFTLPLAARA